MKEKYLSLKQKDHFQKYKIIKKDKEINLSIKQKEHLIEYLKGKYGSIDNINIPIYYESPN